MQGVANRVGYAMMVAAIVVWVFALTYFNLTGPSLAMLAGGFILYYFGVFLVLRKGKSNNE